LKLKIKKLFTAHEYLGTYLLIGALVVGSYYFVRQFMIAQDAWSLVKVSPLTINMLLLYGLWGYYCEKRLTKYTKMKRLMIDFAGFVVITLVFRFGFGMPSIFG
jgi:hypothetical protein